MATRLEVVNLEREKRKDMAIGKGIEIFEPTFNNKKEKNYNGLLSPFFSTDWDDGDEAFAERYSCECGKTTGGIFEGETCPHCGKEVVFVDIDITKTGWMTIMDFHIMNPIAYLKLRSFIGKEPLAIITSTDKTIETKKVPTKYIAIGLIGLKENFIDILDYYYSKKKSKTLEYSEILDMFNKGTAFTNSIPVMSTILRPYSNINNRLSFSTIGKKYEPMRGSVESLNRIIEDNIGSLNDDKMMAINKKLKVIQKRYLALFDEVFSLINGKDGHIRDQLLGGRINFSSRNVIVSDEFLRVNEITLSYQAFLELYRYELIANLVKIHDISISEAINEISWGKINYSKKLHSLMKHLIDKYEYRVLINRNPR
ncbi:MAG: hypothetical protein PHF63_00010 [Herbinix sp.]|nr:hypothetical protein [Herbinix sp.]